MSQDDTKPHLISLKVESKTTSGEVALRDVLRLESVDNPHLSFAIDDESGEAILYASSELHLDAAVGRLLALNIGVNVGPPRVGYLETLTGPGTVDYTHEKRTGSIRQFARVVLRLDKNMTSTGNEFVVQATGANVPKQYINGIDKGVRSVWANGVLIGFPMVDMRVTLLDVAYHPVVSSQVTFEIAARAAMKEGCTKYGVTILEPVMDVEVVTPADFIGGVIGDLNARCALISSQERLSDSMLVLRAQAALAKLLGYPSSLRHLTDGRASHQMVFSHYRATTSPCDPDTFPSDIGMRA